MCQEYPYCTYMNRRVVSVTSLSLRAVALPTSTCLCIYQLSERTQRGHWILLLGMDRGQNTRQIWFGDAASFVDIRKWKIKNKEKKTCVFTYLLIAFSFIFRKTARSFWNSVLWRIIFVAFWHNTPVAGSSKKERDIRRFRSIWRMLHVDPFA